MQMTTSFVVDRPVSSITEGLERCLRVGGYVDVRAFEGRVEARRGSATRGSMSWSVEDWPTLAVIEIDESSGNGCRIAIRLSIRSRFHLVGALEKRLIEAEIASWIRSLRHPERPPLAMKLVAAPIRPRIFRAALLNMLLAAVLLATIGTLANFPAHVVILAATGVALMDGLAILAFADVLIEGTSQVPRIEELLRDGGGERPVWS